METSFRFAAEGFAASRYRSTGIRVFRQGGDDTRTVTSFPTVFAL